MVSSSQIPNEFLISWDPLRPAAAGRNRDHDPQSVTPFQPQGRSPPPTKRLCSACDSCRLSRVKCSGGNSCQRCQNNGWDCKYSVSMRSGRLKATEARRANKVQKLDESQGRSQSQSQSPSNTEGDEQTPSRTAMTPKNASTKTLRKDNLAVPFDDLGLATNLLDGQFFMSDDMLDFGNMSPLGDSTFEFSFPTNLEKLPIMPETGISSNSNSTSISGTGSRRPSSRGHTRDPSIGTQPTPPFFGSPFMSPASGISCQCLTTQLFCVAELCSMNEDINVIGFDAILNIAREKSAVISEYLSCKECSKASTNFIFPAIIFQRLVKLFCSFTKYGNIHAQPMSVGAFKLTDEEDLKHKKLLFTSAVKHIDLVLDGFSDTVRDFQEKEQVMHELGEMVTESGKSNLKWALDTVRNLRLRLRMIVEIVDSPNWGSYEAEESR